MNPLRNNPAGKESMRQLFSYAAVGVVNTGVGYGIIFTCMYLLGVGPVTSNVLGYSVGLVVSYLLNRAFTFRSPSVSKVEFLRFVSIVLLAYGANLAVLVFLIRHTEVHKALAQVLAGIVYFALSFLMNKYYVFAAGRRHSPGA